jgi:Uma2 family endonuclease
LVEFALINAAQRKVEIFRRDPTNHWVLYEFGSDEPVEFASLDLRMESSVLYENV